MVADEPEAVVIIVSYRSFALLARCLDSIEKAECKSVKTVLVDNDSQEDIPERVHRSFPDVHVIALDRNILYTAANNLILRSNPAKYLILVNPDVEVYPDTLKRLLHLMNSDPKIGIAGPRLMRKNGDPDLACRRSRPNYVDMWLWTLGLMGCFPKNRIFGHYNLTYLDPRMVTDVDMVSGAFMVIRRTLITEIGILDEQFPMYGSDIDYCLRAKNAGWRVVYYPDSVAIHVKRGSTSLRQRWALEQFYDEISMLYGKYVAPSNSRLLNTMLLAGLLIRKRLHLWRISISPSAWQ